MTAILFVNSEIKSEEDTQGRCPDLLCLAIIIKLKTEVVMQAEENVSLLKHQAPQMVQLHCNPQQLKASIRQKQAIVAEYTKKVEIKREEMKNLSKSVNTLIDKQLKKPTKERPVFHVTFNSKKLNVLQADKNKIFAEIQTIKQEIKAMQVDFPQAIVKEVMMGHAKMEELISLAQKVEDEKALITRTLEENKEKLSKLNESSCLVDSEKKETELEQMRKECKQMEKEINMFTAEELQRNAYYLEIKAKYQKEVVVQEKEKYVDEAELRQLVLEINQTYEERNAMQKEMTSRLKNKEKIIADLQRSIKEKQGLIRQLKNDSLRASLQSKRMKSTVLLRNHSPTKKTIFMAEESKQLKLKMTNPEEKKQPKRIVNRIYMIQKDDANCIYVGDWQSDAKTGDKPDILINTVQYVKSIVFYLYSGKVVGIKSTYIDKNGLLQQGKELIVKQAEEVQAKIEVSLQDVVQLEYSTKSDDIYVRFFLPNGSWKELGKRGLEVQKINLQPYRFKNIQAQVNDQRTSIRGLKLSLQQKSHEKLALSDVAERTSSQMSFSPTKRKVILKGRSLKKIHEQPLVDHRLMLNKHR